MSSTAWKSERSVPNSAAAMLYVSLATSTGADSTPAMAVTRSSIASIWIRTFPLPSTGKFLPSCAHSNSIANNPIRPGPRNVLGRTMVTHVPSARTFSASSSASVFARP
jgi:hypothetical protein